MSSCPGENGDYSHQFVALEYLFWNNLSGFHHISMRGKQTQVTPALAGYRARTYDVLEKDEGVHVFSLKK